MFRNKGQNGLSWNDRLPEFRNEQTDHSGGRRSQQHFRGPCLDHVTRGLRRLYLCICQGTLLGRRSELGLRIACLGDGEVRGITSRFGARLVRFL